MADFPEESKFLTPDEKAAVIARLKEDQGAAGEAKFSKVHFFNAVKDWRVYCYMLIYIGQQTMSCYSFRALTPLLYRCC